MTCVHVHLSTYGNIGTNGTRKLEMTELAGSRKPPPPSLTGWWARSLTPCPTTSQAGVAFVDLIVEEMEFDTSKVGKVEDPRTGGYMLTAENEG